MAELKTDRELLREYAELGSESAFRALVERHVDLVFATALRGLNNAGAAEEITQNVFIALARKAAWLRGEASLAGWLHKTALFEVRQWWRGELRRQRREQTAFKLGTVMKEENSLLKELGGELDEGLLELRQTDRQALMLRYFEGRSHREIGVLLGAREDAVRMRIEKSLVRLTRFFRRRGYAVPAVATTIIALEATAKAAPAGLAILATRSGLAAGSGGTLAGLKLLIAKFMGLTKLQTTVLCVVLAAAPAAWEWKATLAARKQVTLAQSGLEVVRGQQDQSSTEAGRLHAESARLDAALAEAANNQVRYATAAGKLEALKARVRGLLTDANYRWPDDLPYVRVPKAVVKSLDILHQWPMAFTPSGALNEPALEFFGIKAQEKGPTEQALAGYWRGVQELMTASSYETNLPGTEAGRLTKTVIVPPLGQPLKDLAADTRAQLTALLGADREQLLFAGWDEGGIQIDAPGNVWKISKEPQTFTAWIEPAGADGGRLRYGAGRHSASGGMSSEGSSSLRFLADPAAARFFNPWLRQHGITNPYSHE